MVEHQVTKHRRSGGWLSALVVLVIAACGETTSPDSGSETHFLLECFESCDQGFECLGGVCTENCDADAECSELSEAAVCADTGQGCRVFCDSDADCIQENEDWVCDDGQCVSSQPPVDSPTSECPLFEGGIQEPMARDTTQSAIPSSDDAERVVADDTGVFWQVGENGAVRAFIDDESVELVPPTLDVSVSSRGIITDATTVYFAVAGPRSGEPGLPPPPGSLYAVPKAGGEAELLLQLDDALITPLAVTAEGVLIHSEDRLYVVTDENVEPLEHLPPISAAQLPQVDDGRVYWSDSELTELYAADLEGGDPEVVTEINGRFIVSSSRVVWLTETIVDEDPLTQVDELFMFDLDTGCVTQLPTRGAETGVPMLDARHVYWTHRSHFSTEEGCLETTPLTRVDLTTGALEELHPAGFDVTVCAGFVAQGDDKLYMRTEEYSLVAIDKP